MLTWTALCHNGTEGPVLLREQTCRPRGGDNEESVNFVFGLGSGAIAFFDDPRRRIRRLHGFSLQLYPIHVLIGELEEFFHLHAFAIGSYSAAKREFIFCMAGLVPPSRLPGEPLSGTLRLFIGGFRKYDEKFISAQPEDGIGPTECLLQQGCNITQILVAAEVSELRVDVFEPIHVQ